MGTAIISLGAAALLLAGMLRINTQLRSPRPGAGHLGAAALASGAALLLNAPGVYAWCDHVLFRHPNVSALACYLLTLGAAGAAVEMVARLGTERVAARWLPRVAVAAVASGMAVTFVEGAPVQEARSVPSFFEQYRHDPHLSLFWVLFCSSVTVATCYIAAIVGVAARNDDRHVARGLRLIGAGMCCVAAFMLGCLIQVAAPTLSVPAEQTVLVAGGILLASGMLWPQVATVAQHSSARRRLRPLWETVTARYPYVRVSSRCPDLYRTVIEIHDAIAEARVHHEVDTPLLQALNALPAHPAEQFQATVTDLLHVANVEGRAAAS